MGARHGSGNRPETEAARFDSLGPQVRLLDSIGTRLARFTGSEDNPYQGFRGAAVPLVTRGSVVLATVREREAASGEHRNALQAISTSMSRTRRS